MSRSAFILPTLTWALLRLASREAEIGPGGIHRRLVGGRVEGGQDLSLRHLGVEVSAERPDGSRDLASHGHLCSPG